MQQEQKDLLQALYEEYQGALRLVAYGTGVPDSEVDDIIQDTFCAFMHAYGKKAVDWKAAQRKGALIRILLNRCADYFRELKRNPRTSLDTDPDIDEYEILEDHIVRDTCDILIEREELREIHDCIMEMKPVLRDVAVLYMIQGRSIEEVCEILDISKPNCRMRISRIRKYLKEQLEKRINL